jgi:hypothetical protein
MPTSLLEEATMQVIEDHQQNWETREDTCLFDGDPLCVELKEPAVVPHHACLKFIQPRSTIRMSGHKCYRS